MARSSAPPDWIRLPSVNCCRLAFTTVPDPTISVGAVVTFEAMMSANSVRLFLKPFVETLARLCEMVDISVCDAWRPVSEV